jgi:hypothetical protein
VCVCVCVCVCVLLFQYLPPKICRAQIKIVAYSDAADIMIKGSLLMVHDRLFHII